MYARQGKSAEGHDSSCFHCADTLALLARIDELEKDAAEDAAEQERIEQAVKRAQPTAHNVYETLDLIPKLRAEIERLQAWVNDLHLGMYINCVYCGHRYGPDPGAPIVMADVLKDHIEQCPKHPMSALKAEIIRLKSLMEIAVEEYGQHAVQCDDQRLDSRKCICGFDKIKAEVVA